MSPKGRDRAARLWLFVKTRFLDANRYPPRSKTL
jgi:hypothetical protein